MGLNPKPFQQATIEAALRALDNAGGPRRFLVADEVGLGKTIVAAGVVQKMSARSSAPLKVFYVCSNLAIAAQNRSRLISFLPEEERSDAIAEVDRPSLMPTRESPKHKRVHVFSLTPSTAIPQRQGRVRGGSFRERALARALLDEILPAAIPGMHRALRRSVGADKFESWARYYRGQIRLGRIGGSKFTMAFRHALRTELRIEPGQQLPARIRELVEGDNGLTLVSGLRSALAIAALEQVQPDLVIFDEFQRFRDLLAEAPGAFDDSQLSDSIDGLTARDESASRVLSAILGGNINHRPALLLLSATPYLPYRAREELVGELDPAQDFFELLSFLFGGGIRGRDAAVKSRDLFNSIEEELRKAVPLSDRAMKARADLRVHLCQVMSRTERPRADRDRGQGPKDDTREARLLPTDIEAFKFLGGSLREEDVAWTVPLWNSVPLPMQALGPRYQVWRKAKQATPRPGIVLTPGDRRTFQSNGPWPHPRFRELLEAMPLAQIELPWVAPSLSWWPLEERWRKSRGGAIDGKLLIFSRFRAVPIALSALISFSIEARAFRHESADVGYEDVMRRRFLSADADRPALLALFHPSPLLAQLNPLAGDRGTLRGAKVSIQRQLRRLLLHLGVKVVPHIRRERRRPWELLPMLEQRAKLWKISRGAWQSVADDLESPAGVDVRTGIRSLIEKWDQRSTEDISEIDDDGEFKPLVDLALDSPGVVLARALQRHWAEAISTPENLGAIAGLSWRGLRSYFDAPWFAASLAAGNADYPDAIRRAVVHGNLEAVLDEHFWFLSKAGSGNWPTKLDELESALRLRAANVVFHEGGPGTPQMRLRCHAAVPLNEAQSGASAEELPATESPSANKSGNLRPDEVRRAFNTPFWPHVVTTTSVGQEGLDFHSWCRALAHWDLCSGPVALEQREGRIDRFAGLSVRRAIATQLGNEANRSRSSPWSRLEECAEDRLSDQSGLSPWWVTPGAATQKLFLAVPGSEQVGRRAKLEEDRRLYRLVLGLSDQSDLMDLIQTSVEWDSQTVKAATLDLSAFRADTLL